MIAVAAYVSGKMVDRVGSGDEAGLIRLFVWALFIALFLYALVILATYTRFLFLSSAAFLIRNDLVKSFLRRPLKSFRGENDAFYMNLLTTDISLLNNDYFNVIPYICHSITAILASCIVLFFIQPALVGVALVVAVIPFVTVRPLTKVEQRRKTDYSNVSEKYTEVRKELIEGYETIRQNGGEGSFLRRHTVSHDEMQCALKKYNIVSTLSFETLLSIAGFSNLICLFVGGLLTLRGYISIGMLFAIQSYFSSISNGFSNVLDYFIKILSTRGVVEKISTQEQMAADEGGIIASGVDLGITYHDVSFSFDDRILYKHFDFRAEPGNIYAIVGESGTGKTTLLRLLLKYYDDYSGEIRINDNDIRQISETELYRRVKVVEQTPYIFNASLRDNITMFQPDSETDNALYNQILKKLDLEKVAGQTGDHPLGDFGDRLSGGEKQRIGIARALIHKPSVLLFDEPAASLDPDTRDKINEIIFSLEGITRIVITHDHRPEYLCRFSDSVML